MKNPSKNPSSVSNGDTQPKVQSTKSENINKKEASKIQVEKEGSFMLGEPTFTEIPGGGGRWRCVETGQEMPEKEKETYSKSRACRIGLINSFVAKKRPPLNIFEPNPTNKRQLICKITGDPVNKSEEHIWKHINGIQFNNKLAKLEAEAMLPAPTPPPEEPEEEKKKFDKKEMHKKDKKNINKKKEKKHTESAKLEAEAVLPPPTPTPVEPEEGKKKINKKEMQKKNKINVNEKEKKDTESAKLEAEVALPTSPPPEESKELKKKINKKEAIKKNGANINKKQEKKHTESGEHATRTKRLSIEVGGPSSSASKKKKMKTGKVDASKK